MKLLRVISTLCLAGCGSLLAALAFSPDVAAQIQDLEMYLKWAGAEVVHYEVVAEYSAPTHILGPAPNFPGKWSGAYQTLVKDRFELSFDWNVPQTAPVGTVVFRNSPSSVAPGLLAGSCRPAPPITGTYEHMEILEARADSGDVQLSFKRMYPAAMVPLTNDAGCGIAPVAAATATISHRVAVVPGFMLFLPQGETRFRMGEEGVSAGPTSFAAQPDKLTAVLDDNTRGWKYTYRFRLVK